MRKVMCFLFGNRASIEPLTLMDPDDKGHSMKYVIQFFTFLHNLQLFFVQIIDPQF